MTHLMLVCFINYTAKKEIFCSSRIICTFHMWTHYNEAKSVLCFLFFFCSFAATIFGCFKLNMIYWIYAVYGENDFSVACAMGNWNCAYVWNWEKFSISAKVDWMLRSAVCKWYFHHQNCIRLFLRIECLYSLTWIYINLISIARKYGYYRIIYS